MNKNVAMIAEAALWAKETNRTLVEPAVCDSRVVSPLELRGVPSSACPRTRGFSTYWDLSVACQVVPIEPLDRWLETWWQARRKTPSMAFHVATAGAGIRRANPKPEPTDAQVLVVSGWFRSVGNPALAAGSCTTRPCFGAIRFPRSPSVQQYAARLLGALVPEKRRPTFTCVQWLSEVKSTTDNVQDCARLLVASTIVSWYRHSGIFKDATTKGLERSANSVGLTLMAGEPEGKSGNNATIIVPDHRRHRRRPKHHAEAAAAADAPKSDWTAAVLDDLVDAGNGGKKKNKRAPSSSSSSRQRRRRRRLLLLKEDDEADFARDLLRDVRPVTFFLTDLKPNTSKTYAGDKSANASVYESALRFVHHSFGLDANVSKNDDISQRLEAAVLDVDDLGLQSLLSQDICAAAPILVMCLNTHGTPCSHCARGLDSGFVSGIYNIRRAEGPRLSTDINRPNGIWEWPAPARLASS